MEHRSYERKRVQQRVTLDAPRIGLIAAKMCDISLGGMYIETDTAALRHNAAVLVSFDIPSDREDEHFNLSAMVVRRMRAGAGLMFLRMHTDDIRALSVALSRYRALDSGAQ